VERNAESPPGEAMSLDDHVMTSSLHAFLRHVTYLFNRRIVLSMFFSPSSALAGARSRGSARGAASAILSTAALASCAMVWEGWSSEDMMGI
jgi:hypothetical protein